jgi:16S rRNA (cytidine1402-2'-O)-methyltransferase
MSGTLYIVSTPIGNLEDISFRAIRILKEVSIIAAEDTRRTQKLCASYQIGTSLTSYHDFNKEEKTEILLHRLQEGSSIALVCDAGTPLVSDPGYFLVNAAIKANISLIPIPGPSSVLAALCVSGLPTDRFIFEGFVPRKPGAREKFFEKREQEIGTIIVFETQHRILKTLRAIHKTMGNRQIVLTRELTKLNEEIIRGDVEEICQTLEGKTIKGEITLLIQGQPQRKRKQIPCSDSPASSSSMTNLPFE